MKREPSGERRPVYVRAPPELHAAINRIRIRTSNAERQYVSMGEVARRLLAWAVEHYPQSKTPPR